METFVIYWTCTEAGSRITCLKTGRKETKMINQQNMDMLLHAAKYKRLEAWSEVLDMLHQKLDSLIDESENLEHMDLVVDLEPEQRIRAAVLENEIELLISLTEILHDLKGDNEKEGAEDV